MQCRSQFGFIFIKKSKYMRLSLTSIIILLLTHFSSPLLAQEAPLPEIKLEVEYKGPHQTVVGATKSIPPHFIYKTDGYDFQIELSITVQKYFTFSDSMYGIVCILPDHSVAKFYFDKTHLIRTSSQNYRYSFPLRIDRSGWINVFMA